jgi:hypothetical protein
MNTYIQAFDERLRDVFEQKAAEFSRYAEEDPTKAIVTAQLAGLYKDLVEALRH